MFSLIQNTSRGILQFHGITEVVLNTAENSTTFSAVVSSYFSEADYLQKLKPIKHTKVYIPVSATGNNYIKSLEQYITETDLSSIFYGGNIKNYSSDPLQLAKDTKWTIIKDCRMKAISSIDMEGSQATINAATQSIKNYADSLHTTINNAITVEQVDAVIWNYVP